MVEKNKYQILVEAVDKLPKEAVEKAKKEVTRKGYDTTGYQYQFLVNVLNEIVGIGDWGFSYKILKELEGKWGNGKGFWEITTEVLVWIMVEKDKKAEFACIGGHKSEMHVDALKGAITNGFKKTVAFFGIGKKAYEGTIDDDYRPIPQSNGNSKEIVVEPLTVATNGAQKPVEGSEGENKPLSMNQRFLACRKSLKDEDYYFILSKFGVKSATEFKDKEKAEEALKALENNITAKGLE